MLSGVAERLDEPTARGLARAVGRAVGDGTLRPGTRLPPIRSVAEMVGMSPTTVSAAWAMLVRSGTIHTDGRRGTVVTEHSAGPTRYRRAAASGASYRLDLSTGTPDPRLLADLRPALSGIEPHLVPASYLDDPVIAPLQALLRDDWPFAAERFAVVDGAMDAMQLIASAHLTFGDRVAVEQPSFPPLLDLLESVGAVPVPVAVDDDGPLPADLRAALDSGARMVIIQPRAQNPTGASVTARRAAALAAALKGTDVTVVEDDSAGAVAASTLHSVGAALPAQTMHVRSYSKSHGPDLRLAAIGGAADLVDPLVERRFLGQGWTSRLLQTLLVQLLTGRATVRAVERAKQEYAHRREALVDALATRGVEVRGKDGLNIWVPVADEQAALLRLATRGIGVLAGEPFWTGTGGAPHIRVTAGLVDGTLTAEVAGELAAAAATGAPSTVR